MKTVAEIIAEELKKNNINDIFMLTGYGAMYLNDAIEKKKIKYYAARNEAAAPMMAEAYAKYKNSIGAVCVTAGPGATNALPGLAEAYVDSAPILILSGQVERKFSSDTYKKIFLRTLGIAEFSITRIVKNITKYSVTIRHPQNCLYEIQKALYLCKHGRPGPVWVEIPLDIQSYKIKNPNKLKKYRPNNIKKKLSHSQVKNFINFLNKSQKPLFIIGNGVKQSQTKKLFYLLAKSKKIPFFTSRFANDLIAHNKKEHLGLIGIKGSVYCQDIIKKSDLIIALGCRLAPALTAGIENFFGKKIKSITINNDYNEINNPLLKFNLKINSDLNPFFKKLKSFDNKIYEKENSWLSYCNKIKINKEIPNIYKKKNPIDLYRFMYDLGKYTSKNHILITDAGSNYYIGGQVWKFEKGQIEIASSSNAAMGLSVPLSIGAAVASNKQIMSVTGDGSIELNIQELKTISHYNLNIKTFVINNGGYVSMKKWQDDYFDGNRLDTEDKTGVGTMNFKKIADAFNLKYLKIKNVSEIEKKIKFLCSRKEPYLIEVFTDPNQYIYGKKF